MILNQQDWGIAAIAVVALYVVTVMYRVYQYRPVLEHRVYFWGSVWFFLSLVSRVIVKLPFWPDLIDPNYVTDTFVMLAISHVLVGLAIVVRESKPIVSRFPLALAFTPFLLVPAHLIVSHTFVLKQILYTIYEFGATIIGLLIYGLMAASDRRYLNVIYGIILFAISLSLQWVTIPVSIEVWVHWILVTTALILTTKSYKSIIRQTYEPSNRQ
jgi:hypothetical protein